MDALNRAVTAALHDLPIEMKRSLAWDQGKEIHGHESLRNGGRAHGLRVQPAQPVAARQQREHPTGSCASGSHAQPTFTCSTAQVIAAVQASLNNRPRHTLGFRTPADVLATAC
jgi:IS30 family transposase